MTLDFGSMTELLTLSFRQPPSAAAYMARALYPWAGLVRGGEFSRLRASWTGHRIEPRQLAGFQRRTGLSPEQGWILYPQVFAFRLQMAILTHPAWPLPIWNALQVRNHLVLHQPIPVGAQIDLEAGALRERRMEKGVEVDLHTSVRRDKELLWEGLTTFYYRGRHRGTDAPSELDRRPDPPREVRAAWTMRRGGRWEFGRLTGDYNGIHQWDWYARRLGFPRAFFHPQAAVGECLSRLEPRGARSQRLDAWIKGPVYYGSAVELRAADDPDGTRFALHLSGDERPALLGRWSGNAGEELQP